jgi:hypothetical protein
MTGKDADYDPTEPLNSAPAEESETARFIPLEGYRRLTSKEMTSRAAGFRDEMIRRRTVRDFSPEEVPDGLLEDCLRTAGSAPSGANRQPWHFVLVRDSETKRRIRQAAEAEELEFYTQRAPKEGLDALAPLGTDENKPFLETAPVLIAEFTKT